MKKNILVVILLAVICFGCGREERGHITQRGKEIHDTWCEWTNVVLSESVLPAFRLSAFLAAGDSLQRVIMEQYFGQQHIWQDGENTYGIYENGVCLLTVNTNGTSLSDEGTTWQVTSSQLLFGLSAVPLFAADSESPRTLSITHLAGNQWRITLDSVSYKGSMADLLLTLPEGTDLEKIGQSELTLSGSGCLYFDRPESPLSADDSPVVLLYSIASPLLQSDEFFSFKEGEIQYVAKKEGKEEIPVLAKFLGGGSVKITYRDFTEIWDGDFYYMD